jgi:hypothetical protein
MPSDGQPPVLSAVRCHALWTTATCSLHASLEVSALNPTADLPFELSATRGSLRTQAKEI